MCVEVEVAVGARKIKSSDSDSGSAAPPSTTEKKSSFAKDVWLAQRDAGKKIEVQRSEPDELSSQDVGQLNTISTTSDCSSAGPKWARSDGQEWTKTSANDSHLSAESVKQAESRRHSRSRSRSPVNVRAHSSRKSRKSQSPSVHLRQLEERKPKHSSARLPSPELTRRSMYTSEKAPISDHSSLYDKEWPPFAGSSSVLEPQLKSALRKQPTSLSASVEQKPSSSSASVELYSTAYNREHDALNNIPRYQQISRNAYYLSQMRNMSQ